VERRTVLLLLRARYTTAGRNEEAAVREETQVFGYRKKGTEFENLREEESTALLHAVATDNISQEDKHEFAKAALRELDDALKVARNELEKRTKALNERAASVQKALRIRRTDWKASGEPDLLGLLTLVPRIRK
jgi:hypothetical protein